MVYNISMRDQDKQFIKIMIGFAVCIALWHTIETNCLVPPLATIPF